MDCAVAFGVAINDAIKVSMSLETVTKYHEDTGEKYLASIEVFEVSAFGRKIHLDFTPEEKNQIWLFAADPTRAGYFHSRLPRIVEKIKSMFGSDASDVQVEFGNIWLMGSAIHQTYFSINDLENARDAFVSRFGYVVPGYFFCISD